MTPDMTVEDARRIIEGLDERIERIRFEYEYALTVIEHQREKLAAWVTRQERHL